MAGKGPYVEPEKRAMSEIWEAWDPRSETLLEIVSKNIERLPGRQPSNVEKYIVATHGRIKEIPDAPAVAKEDHVEQTSQIAGVDPNAGQGSPDASQPVVDETGTVQSANKTSVGEEMMGTLPQGRRSTLAPLIPRTTPAPGSAERIDRLMGKDFPDSLQGPNPGVEQVTSGQGLDKPAEGTTVNTVKATMDGEQAAGTLYTAISDLRKVREQIEVLKVEEAKLAQTVKEALQVVNESVGV